ncbi:MAG: glucose-1-phosphate adenylyltransferase [Thermomicrobiales bacterium]|jgi:glucose-1-phosphate adenylyltransferase|nr:glucose-1-phosphate adenylyltransferase [Thermomicrobiales bacterium]
MERVVVMILAGGQGERLSILSRQRAKPAVPFGGKYRIIDFSLSNCVNSGYYNVGVLTQYRPHSLNDHIGIGRPWDLDRQTGGVRLLQPYLGHVRSDWYRGTADAIYHNLFFIEPRQFRDVLILSGDHIYAMDYRPMIQFHREAEADVTVAVQEVPWSDASRFGVMATAPDRRVIEFQEKPAEPRSNLASMGIYVFRKEALIKALRGENTDRSMVDFGKDVIPYMIARGGVFAYPFEGYWQDVGTIQSYWEANMDLLLDPPPLNLYDPDWRMHTRSEERPPAKLLDGAVVTQSLISHGCLIRGTVEHSVLSPGVVVRAGAVIRDSVIMTDTVIGEGAVLDRCIVDKEVVIGPGAQLGVGDDSIPNMLEPTRLNSGITLLGRKAHVPAGVTVGRNVLIAPDVQERHFTSRDVSSGDAVDIHLHALSY